MSFEGVQQAFAIQAGREVRILVKPDQIDDLSSARLARDIAKKIEETMHTRPDPRDGDTRNKGY